MDLSFLRQSIDPLVNYALQLSPLSPFSPRLLPSLPFPFSLAVLTGGKLVTASQPELLARDQHVNRSYYISEALLEIFILQLLLNSSFSGKFRMKTLSYTGCYCSWWVYLLSVFSHVIPLLCLTDTEGIQIYLLVYLLHHAVSSGFHSHLLLTPTCRPLADWSRSVNHADRHSVCPHRDLNTLCRAQLSIAIFLTQATNNSGMASPSCGQKDIYQAEFYLLGVAIHNRARPLILPP